MQTVQPGEPIFHPNYGAGVISEIQEYTIDGDHQRYAVIDLTRGNHLLIPVDRLEEIGVRPADSSFAKVDQVFAEDPRELSPNPKIRQARIRKRIYSGNPMKLAEVLRDLAWYARQARLATRDTIYQEQARQMLGSELALNHSVDLEDAMTKIDTMLATAIQVREETATETPAGDDTQTVTA